MRRLIAILIAALQAAALLSCGGPEFHVATDLEPTSRPDGGGDDASADGGGSLETGPREANTAETGPPEANAPEMGPPETGAADGPAATTIDLTPSKDAYVEDGPSVDTNFGASAQLRVKGNDGLTLDRNSWLSFDVSGFSSVSAASLRLWVVTIDTGNTNPIPNQFLYAPTASDGWTENTVTWSTAPAAGQQVAQTTVVDAQLNTWVEVDVTAPVSTDSDGVATFVVTSPQYTGRGLTYSSREGANKPVLRVTGVPR
jgi:hypothetical protein